jgi:hypothetical protein
LSPWVPWMLTLSYENGVTKGIGKGVRITTSKYADMLRDTRAQALAEGRNQGQLTERQERETSRRARREALAERRRHRAGEAPPEPRPGTSSRR